MEQYTFWQAPDRDSPRDPVFDASATIILPDQMKALLQMDGARGTVDEDVQRVTGLDLSRVRRWHKIFERMGLLYQGEDKKTVVSDLGRLLFNAQTWGARSLRRDLARNVLRVLRKYQLKNPSDDPNDQYPKGTDIHPYWAIWKAVVELEGKLHWDELNREIFRSLKHEDLPGAIQRIREARRQPDYDAAAGGSPTFRLSDRCYDQAVGPGGREGSAQVRDQKTTPWFRRAGFGGLLLVSPQVSDAERGYWTIAPDIGDLLEAEVRRGPAQYRDFLDEQEWFRYFCSIDDSEQGAPAGTNVTAEITSSAGIDSPLPLESTHSEVLDLLLGRKNVILYGPPGTGKTRCAFDIAQHWRVQNGADSVISTTFHPSYSYEDFVQGYRPEPKNASQYVMRPGALLEACKRARELSLQSKSALLVIDEINRGDVARIFGELITLIEPDKRDVTICLAQSPDEKFWIPSNLFFLGTMNTADRSISLLDVALRRRFAFYEFPPRPTAFGTGGWLASVGGRSLGDLLSALNSRLLREGVEPDRAVGHALLGIDSGVADPVRALWDRLTYDILPLVTEYCYVDRHRVRRIMGPLVDENGRVVSREGLIAAVAKFLGSAPESDETVSPGADE